MKSIGAKFLTAVGLMTVLLAGVTYYQGRTATDSLIVDLTSQQAALALEFNQSIRAYVRDHVRPEMAERVGPNEFIPEAMSTSYVARSIFDSVRTRFPNYLLKFSSDNPRNPANLAGPEETAILEYFRQNPDATEWKGRIRIGEEDYFAHFHPQRMERSCVRCHGNSEDAPAALVSRYGTEAGFHRKVGDVIAMDAVGIPLAKIDAAVSHQASNLLRDTLLIGGLGFASIFVLFRYIVTGRLASIARHFRRAAEGTDRSALTPIPVKGADEISDLAASFNALAARIVGVHESLENRVQERTAELEAEVARRKEAEDEKRARLNRVRQQQSALARIATLPAGVDGDLAGAAEAIVELAGSALEVERTGIWMLAPDRREMRCLDLYQLSSGSHQRGKQLKINDAARLLDSLDEGRVIDAVDVKTDPRLREFLENHLVPGDIASLLVGSIRLSGSVVGGVSFGSCGVQRRWTDDEIAFARQVADQVVQVLSNEQRKHAEESLRQHAGELEAANRTLAEASRAAEAATAAKSGFLANMSHEIRTPMTAILGFTDILLEHVTGSECEEAARTIQRNGVYLLEIINGLLDLAKIEAGKMETVRVPCNPASIVGEVVRLMEGRAAEKGLAMDVEYPGPLPPQVTTDPALLRQILINLVGNAIKFTERGSIRIVVQTLVECVPSRLAIRVIDTGSGMTAQQIERVFHPFTQADSSTTRRHGGTGLGLTISKQLATLLEGDLSVESTPGTGSTFRLTIPTGSVYMLPVAELVRKSDREPAGTTALRGEVPALCGRILLVEDGLDNQRLISILLKKAGAEVDLAANGQVAVDTVLASPDAFDLVLMDMQMPVMDGYQATQRLRQEGYTGPIVALTAHAMDHHRQKCLDVGCDAYVTKPIDRPLLYHVLREYLASAQQTPEPLGAVPQGD